MKVILTYSVRTTNLLIIFNWNIILNWWNLVLFTSHMVSIWLKDKKGNGVHTFEQIYK